MELSVEQLEDKSIFLTLRLDIKDIEECPISGEEKKLAEQLTASEGVGNRMAGYAIICKVIENSQLKAKKKSKNKIEIPSSIIL